MTWLGLADQTVRVTRDVFGHAPVQAVTYTAAGQLPASINAPFLEQFTTDAIDPDGTPINSKRPVLDIRLADIPGGKCHRDDIVTIGSRSFTVDEVERDADGVAAKCFLLETT